MITNDHESTLNKSSEVTSTFVVQSSEDKSTTTVQSSELSSKYTHEVSSSILLLNSSHTSSAFDKATTSSTGNNFMRVIDLQVDLRIFFLVFDFCS